MKAVCDNCGNVGIPSISLSLDIVVDTPSGKVTDCESILTIACKKCGSILLKNLGVNEVEDGPGEEDGEWAEGWDKRNATRDKPGMSLDTGDCNCERDKE